MVDKSILIIIVLKFFWKVKIKKFKCLKIFKAYDILKNVSKIILKQILLKKQTHLIIFI